MIRVSNEHEETVIITQHEEEGYILIEWENCDGTINGRNAISPEMYAKWIETAYAKWQSEM